MTPSELRAAAEFIKHPVLPLASGATGETEHFVGVVLPRFSASAHVLANHILATVRDDDDEAVLVDRLGWVTRATGRYMSPESNGKDPTVCVALDPPLGRDGWSIACCGNYCSIPPVETMRDLRDLCRVLGIELRETP